MSMFQKSIKQLCTFGGLSCLGLVCSLNLHAYETFSDYSDRTGTFYLSTGLGFAAGRGSEDTYQSVLNAGGVGSVLEYDDDRFGWYFGLGYQPFKHFAIEIDYVDLADADVRIGAPSDAELTVAQDSLSGLLPIHSEGFGAKLVGILPLESQWRMLVKLGYHQWKDTGSRQEQETPYIGLSFDKYLTENINLVFSADRYEIDETHFPMVKAGIAYYFGSQEKAPVAKEPMVEKPMVQEPKAMVEEQPVVEEKPMVEPEPVPDLDQDGVPDDVDACLGSKPGAVVDNFGCELQKEVRVEIQFESGSSQVSSIDEEQFKHVAKTLESNSELKINIEGHTDASGGAVMNKKLSQARAQAVATLLVEKYGVKKQALNVKGFGEDQPIASNETQAGKQQNRRVMIKLEGQE